MKRWYVKLILKLILIMIFHGFHSCKTMENDVTFMVPEKWEMGPKLLRPAGKALPLNWKGFQLNSLRENLLLSVKASLSV